MTTSALRTRVTPVPGVPDACAIQIVGPVTYREAWILRKSLVRAISEASGSRLAIDLAGMSEIDTAGAAVLVEAYSLGRARGLRVLLCSPDETAIRLFRLSGVDALMEACCSCPREIRQRLMDG